MDIVSKIKSYIDDNGLKQSYIADKAGIKRDAFCTSLNGKRKIAIDEYCRICAALGVGFDFFMPVIDYADKSAGLAQNRLPTEKAG